MKPIPQMLQFIANSNGNKDTKTNEELVILANSIVEQCRKKLLLVTDDRLKVSLNALIAQTAAVLNAASRKEASTEVLNECKKLESIAITLPDHIQEKNTLSSMSYSIAKACVFVLAFTACISLGFAFDAWYFGYLTLHAFLDYAVGVTSFIGIPAASLGLFAYGLHRSQNDKSKDICDLQQDVHTFCKRAVDSYGLEAKAGL